MTTSAMHKLLLLRDIFPAPNEKFLEIQEQKMNANPI